MEENIVERKPLPGVESLEWVSRFQASGLSVQRFARQNGIPPGQLHYWLYAKHPQGKRKPKPPKPPLFAEVKVDGLLRGDPWVAEIGLPKGMTLRLGATVSPEWAGKLARSLRELC